MILATQSIRYWCQPPRLMLTPFAERTLHQPTGMTFGVGPCTYDVRVAQDVHLQSHSFMLISTIEKFLMPDMVCGVVMDKSTLARRGIAVQNTHIDPGWRGHLTIELSNHSLKELNLPKGSPIAQIKFELLYEPTMNPYEGKYQDQENKPVGAL